MPKSRPFPPDIAARVRDSLATLDWGLHQRLPDHLRILRKRNDTYADQRQWAKQFIQWNLVNRIWSLLRARRKGYLSNDQIAEFEEYLREFAQHQGQLVANGLRIREEIQRELQRIADGV